jgi:long-chain fatty acid transport protein
MLVTLALTLASGAASAQALTSPNVGTGLSGAATADPAAVWWNPAMLGFLDRPTILIGGSLIAGDAQYTRERRATYQRADGLGFALPVSAQSVDASRTGVAPTATGLRASWRASGSTLPTPPSCSLTPTARSAGSSSRPPL